MRPQQQGRRQRNRGSSNNNRGRSQNPLSRSYESNGPDVKIRGNAQQVADKYETLASDAQSSGDRVMAENYLQHAEHYKRIIMAAQTQAREEQEQRDRQSGQQNNNNENQYDDDDDSDDNDQPKIDGVPAEVQLGEDQQPVTDKPKRRRPAAKKDNGENADGSSQANASDDHETDQDKPAPRKRKRPVKVAEAEGASSDDSADEASAVNV